MVAASTVVVTDPVVAAALVVRAEVGARDQARERPERGVPETDQDSRAVVAAAARPAVRVEVGARDQVRGRPGTSGSGDGSGFDGGNGPGGPAVEGGGSGGFGGYYGAPSGSLEVMSGSGGDFF